MSRIPLLVPDLPDQADLAPLLAQIDAARWYTNFGPLARRFETRLGEMFAAPAPALTSVANGTLALELALAALGLPPRARVLAPALTFVATGTAVLRAGHELVIGDVDPRSWLLTPGIAREAHAAAGLDCVMPVAAFGCPVPVEEWDRFSRETGVKVLIDAAGALGHQAVGERGVVAFSLHATKAFGIGEGGLLASRDAALVARARALSNFGIDLNTGLATGAGMNAKLSEYHAAVGLAALDRWAERSRLRRALHEDYLAVLADACPALTFQQRPGEGVYSILQIALPGAARRDAVARALAVAGIETRAWYLPLLHRHPACAGARVLDLPVAEGLAARLLGLPFHLALTRDDVRCVGRELAAAINAA